MSMSNFYIDSNFTNIIVSIVLISKCFIQHLQYIDTCTKVSLW